MQRGDIVLVNLPQPAGAAGHEQFGDRPALAVHSDATGVGLSVIMIVPITSNLAAKNFPHAVEIQPSAQNGLSMPYQAPDVALNILDSDQSWRLLLFCFSNLEDIL